MSLQNLQAEFAESIFSDAPQTDLLQPADSMVVYRNNVTANLVMALKTCYPLIIALIGEDYFYQIAQEYTQYYPSLSSDLHEYGEYFSDFLSEHVIIKKFIYLPEVAQFEWACQRLYFAADLPALDIRLLESITPEQCEKLHFVLHPASCLKRFHYPMFQIIDVCKSKQEKNVNLDAGGVNLLIIRRELEIMLVPLSLAEYTFLQLLHDNEPLSSAYAAATKIDPAFNLNDKLPAWVNNKTLVDFYLGQ